MAATEKVKLALVGCGNIARAHWRGVRYHAPHIEVTAVVDTNAKRAAAMAERTVAPDETILDVVEQAGLNVPTSCVAGICGACETKVLEGVPDHQDAILTDPERPDWWG